MLRRFAKDDAGSIGAVMTLGTLMLLGAISASLDYTRMTNTRAALGAAIDAAALAAAQAPADKAAAVARQVFDANFRGASEIVSFAAAPFKKGDDNAFRVEATANVQMTLAQAIGFTSAPVRTASEVMIGNDYDIQVALVLDVTGSMRGQKLTALKTSATTMVDTLYDKLKRSNQVKMGVAPFSEYVNIGISNRGKSWTENTQDYTETYSQCEWKRVKSKQTWVCEDRERTYKWGGCVGSRNYPLNVRDDSYSSDPVPGVFNVTCPDAMLPLTASRPSVVNAINALSATGNTYIPAGLMWGWAMMSPGQPFDEKTDAKRTTKRYLVLMTDGENTISPTYPYHEGRSANSANALTAELCTNIKLAGVEVFTIAFQVNTNTLKNLLRNCATSADKYFDATNSTLLADAFEAITRQMSNLRIVR